MTQHKKEQFGQLDVEPVTSLEGVVDRIVFESEETGFFVGRLKPEHALHDVTFVGNLMAISPGETIRMKGRWIEDHRFGKQFKVESWETILPATVEGIERYLGSGLIQGIGPKYAERLVKAFGVDL